MSRGRQPHGAHAVFGRERDQRAQHPGVLVEMLVAVDVVERFGFSFLLLFGGRGLCGGGVLAPGAGASGSRIEKYYEELMPTIRQASKLTVRERDKRFAPAITGAFDLATMTRLAVGPPWRSFSPAQQTAAQEAFTRFIVADYASQIDDYSGEKFVVDPQTVPETRGGGEIVKTRLQQSSGRTVIINYLVRGGRVIDVYLNGTISDLATRRDEFASIIAAGGADGLVKRLHERTQTLLSK